MEGDFELAFVIIAAFDLVDVPGIGGLRIGGVEWSKLFAKAGSTSSYLFGAHMHRRFISTAWLRLSQPVSE
jgi:hypothetical protein